MANYIVGLGRGRQWRWRGARQGQVALSGHRREKNVYGVTSEGGHIGSNTGSATYQLNGLGLVTHAL